jgi:hypothetical protein
MGCLGDTSDPADISHAAFLRRLLLPSGTAGTNVGKSARYAGENRDPLQIVDRIRNITEVAALSQHESPCLSLAVDAWNDPALVSECHYCHRPLKFNPFIVGRQERKRWWRVW